ncbi:hypothetical protein Tco_0352965 [Tanacetum coccineum]
MSPRNNDVRNDLEDFKRRIRSMRIVHWKLYDSDNRKTTGVLPNKKSKPINQEPQSKIDFEKSMTKFLDDQRVSNIFVKNNFNDMILKMNQNEKDFQTKIKNMERKIDKWEKPQNVFAEQTDRTGPPPPQAHTEQVNAIFTESGKSDDSSKIQTLPSIIVIVDEQLVLYMVVDEELMLYEQLVPDMIVVEEVGRIVVVEGKLSCLVEEGVFEVAGTSTVLN